MIRLDYVRYRLHPSNPATPAPIRSLVTWNCDMALQILAGWNSMQADLLYVPFAVEFAVPQAPVSTRKLRAQGSGLEYWDLGEKTLPTPALPEDRDLHCPHK